VNNGEAMLKALGDFHSNKDRDYSHFFWLDKDLLKWREAIKSNF
jgi:hypothetical protein